MQKRYTMLKTSLNAANTEKAKVEDLLAAAELQNIGLRDKVQELMVVESRVSEWKKMKSLEINRQFSSIPSLKR
jgi:F0F1-type ATP synthase membrane subunit b/b'